MDNPRQAQEVTAHTLRQVLDSPALTHLTLPERAALADEVARLFPAGNVPSLVTASLMQQSDKKLSAAEHRRNLHLLMQGMQTFVDRAVYQTFYAGPAALLNAYQLILKLAGQDPQKSFNEGTWQFYVEFGLREDTGRHACETVGFHETILQEHLRVDEIDTLSAWLTAASWLLSHYEALLAAEWLERVQLRHLASYTNSDYVGDWIRRKPYTVPLGSADYLQFRASVFHNYYESVLDRLDPETRANVITDWELPAHEQQRRADLSAYQRQLSIRANLTPSEYSDARTRLEVTELAIGVIFRGRYFLVRALDDQGKPLTPTQARILSAAILDAQSDEPAATLDETLIHTHRSAQPALRRLIPPDVRGDFEALRKAPILINWDDEVSPDQPISLIRQGRRGIGDHAMTVFRTEESFIFDLSHIFFDGPWGLATAEILTGQAIHMVRQLVRRPRPTPLPKIPIRPLHLQTSLTLIRAAQNAILTAEVSAETDKLRLKPIQNLQTLLQKRNTTLRLTVNDILMLYRSLFGPDYQLSPELDAELSQMERSSNPQQRKAVQLARQSIEQARQPNPALLIPMDATIIDPKERIYPTTFRNPFADMLAKHRLVNKAYNDYEASKGNAALWGIFEEARRDYLGMFVLFSDLVASYKHVTMQGESVSTNTIRLLGGLPDSVKRLLDSVPDRFDAVNDLVKGQEVFSNVGRVSSMSTLRRFITAKDDNEKKTLAWGIMTDATGIMHLSLRDFRPHVGALLRIGRGALAQRIAQDLLDTYAGGVNQFVAELNRIIGLRRPPTVS
jgi:hypothetical protein